ncbi:hypothetical protein PYCCODRAFT_1469275 [Trametes coccinea BRFM310]|uniref:Protein kinase domain-containing protein n=1 Tax=Trametes coccinea (strain BRFM310) TaxID=1353009 RepID=A0A1Y2IL17_TRAC3|nr:hypothetical protein PYCCODRAFT_1469275 [Trametes coccinea BRFM310]
MSTNGTGGPPWLAFNSDGSIHLSGVPERIIRHPGLKKRGITLADALKPGVIFRSVTESVVVKVLDLNREELQIYERLIPDLAVPENHIVPCEIDRLDHPLLIMPTLRNMFINVHTNHTPHSTLLHMFHDLVEGIEYLHRHNIAHMDICYDNAMIAMPQDVAIHPELTPGRVYLIDFDSARQFKLRPGVQPAITLPETQADAPDGLTYFDPYSWDVYCLGKLFEYITDFWCEDYNQVPWIIRRYIQWLIGEERGCHEVCRCRPTAKTARRVLAAICAIWSTLDTLHTVFSTISSLLTAP